MGKIDLVIHGGHVVSESGSIEASVAIEGGKVVMVGDPAGMPPAKETFRADGMHLLPGAIDSHVHFRDPGYVHKENWATGTAAAAMGGVTTVFEMPNTNPTTGTIEALRIKQQSAKSACVDYGIYGLLSEESVAILPQLAEAGVTSFKCFMGNTFGDLPAPSDGAILEGFETLAELGLRCTVHAENASIMARRQEKMEAAGRIDQHAHLAARPELCEIEAVGRAILFAEWTGARLHIAHFSSADALYQLREGKRRGVDVTAETCPQYLLLNTADMSRLAGILRVNPPVREARHNQPLWDALAEGVVDMIATDHAPHTPEEKTRKRIWDCDCGFPGVETQMPIMLTEVNAGRMGISDYVRWSSANPARAWGLYGTKGVIAPGADADIAIVDLKARASIDQGALQSLAKISPWHGRAVQGLPMHTLVRGHFVMRDRRMVDGMSGWGQSVKAVQRMPAPKPRNTDRWTKAIIQTPVKTPA